MRPRGFQGCAFSIASPDGRCPRGWCNACRGVVRNVIMCACKARACGRPAAASLRGWRLPPALRVRTRAKPVVRAGHSPSRQLLIPAVVPPLTLTQGPQWKLDTARLPPYAISYARGGSSAVRPDLLSSASPLAAGTPSLRTTVTPPLDQVVANSTSQNKQMEGGVFTPARFARSRIVRRRTCRAAALPNLPLSAHGQADDTPVPSDLE